LRLCEKYLFLSFDCSFYSDFARFAR